MTSDQRPATRKTAPAPRGLGGPCACQISVTKRTKDLHLPSPAQAPEQAVSEAYRGPYKDTSGRSHHPFHLHPFPSRCTPSSPLSTVESVHCVLPPSTLALGALITHHLSSKPRKTELQHGAWSTRTLALLVPFDPHSISLNCVPARDALVVFSRPSSKLGGGPI